MIRQTLEILLRPLEGDDWPALLDCLGDPETVRYTEFEPFTEVSARRLARWASEKRREEPQTVFAFAVCLTPCGEAIGIATLTVRDVALREADIGFIIGRRHRGKGYATAAVRALLALGFGPLGLHRISGECDPDNPGSARVMEKNGMTHEGLLRERRWQKGRWVDRLLYAVLDRDWGRL